MSEQWGPPYYTERNPTVHIVDLSVSQMGALKDLADFLMLIKGNDLNIYSSSLLAHGKNKGTGMNGLNKVINRLFQTRYFMKTFYHLVRYAFYKPKEKFEYVYSE